jgi:CHAT domain-containing protein
LPDDLSKRGKLAVENEQIAVLEALSTFRKEGLVELEIPNDGRFESLKHHIEKFKPHLVFLSGHSGYEEGKGYFLFEDKRGFSTYIDEEKLSTAFTGSTVESVVLSSCQSAQADDTRLNSGLARALAFKGINNVIGMSQNIYDKAGATFAEHFVTALANKKTIALALQKGREEISKLEG